MSPSEQRVVRLFGVGRLRRIIFHLICAAFAVYILMPVYWLVIAATKTNSGIVNTFGFWLAMPFHLFQNLSAVFTYDNGAFTRWFLNTVFYAAASGLLATLFGGMAGYGFAKYHFWGKRPLLGLVIGAFAIPNTALVIPLYLLFARLHLVNDPLGLILPSIGGVLGATLMYVYIRSAISDDLLDAARLDGAGEFRTFWKISVPMMVPGAVTVLLFAVVGTWNNYFLPLVLFSKPDYYPLTVGLSGWVFTTTSGHGRNTLYPLIVAGGLVTVIPTVILFLVLQRYWRAGIAAGSVR